MTLAPGLLIAASATAAVLMIGGFLPMVSPLLIAIVLGAVVSKSGRYLRGPSRE